MSESKPVQTILSEDVEVVGSIKSNADIQIQGKLNGDLLCNGNAIIGETASIKGNITADSTSISGQVAGNVTAKDRIELKSTARLNGDIRSKRLTVEDGVTFIGKSEVNPAGAPAHGQPAKSPAEPAGEASGTSGDEAARQKAAAPGRK